MHVVGHRFLVAIEPFVRVDEPVARFAANGDTVGAQLGTSSPRRAPAVVVALLSQCRLGDVAFVIEPPSIVGQGVDPGEVGM